MATLLDLITDAYGEIGVLGEGEVPTAAQAALGLRKTNDLVDQWAAERLAIYTITRTLKTVTASDGEYSVGSGGDINIARPVYLDHVNLVETSADPDRETELRELTDDEYAAIVEKARTATNPNSWYYNPTFATARGTLSLFPIPTSSTLQIALYVPTAVAEFAATSDSVSLPPGYKRMIVKNLALELAPSFQRQIDPELRRQAMEAKSVVKRANVRMAEMSFPADVLMGRGGVYDIKQG
jgi:hypothetical protein